MTITPTPSSQVALSKSDIRPSHPPKSQSILLNTDDPGGATHLGQFLNEDEFSAAIDEAVEAKTPEARKEAHQVIGFLQSFIKTEPWLSKLQERKIQNALEKDPAQLLTLIKTLGINVNATIDGVPLINWAHQSGKDQHVQALMDVPGIQLDYHDDEGETLLHNIIRRDDDIELTKKFCKKLLIRGADPNKANNLGKTPLHMAAKFNKPDIVQILLENGADPNKKSKLGNTPLMETFGNKDNHIVKKLLEENGNYDMLQNVDYEALL